MLMLENVSVIQGLIAKKLQNDSDDKRQNDKTTVTTNNKTTKRQLHYSLERL